METHDKITHEGIVLKTGKKLVVVKMIVKSACASCQVKSACSLSETEEKIVEVRTDDTFFNKGDRVIVGMKSSQGYKALLLGYILPFVVLVGFLIIFQNGGFDEGGSALMSFGFLALYYIVLYFFKNHLKKTFSYSISKVEAAN